MKKILVPTDFSRQSHYALDLAYDLAKKTEAEIILVHIVELRSTSVFAAAGEIVTPLDPEEHLEDILRIAKEEITSIIDDPKFDKVTLKHITKTGNPFASISKVIASEDADLVIMGTSGTTNLEDWFVGSNTEKVVRMAKCPVIAVPSSCTLESIKNIIFPTNFDFCEHLIDHLKLWQETCKAKLHLVRINTPHNFEAEEYIMKNLQDLAEKHGLKNYELHIENCITVEDGILNFTEEHNGDMIAMATHGKRGLFHLFSSSIAEDVVNHTLKPVWTYSLKN